MSSVVAEKAKRANEMIANLSAAKKQDTPTEAPSDQPTITDGDGDQVKVVAPEQPELQPQEGVMVQQQELDGLRAKAREADSLLAQYRTLQGKYNAEVPRLSQQVKELQQQISDLSNERHHKEPQGSVSDALAMLRENLGDELADTLANYVRSVSTDAIAANIDPIKKRVETTEATAAKSAEESLFNAIDRRLSSIGINFNELNNDPNFIAWLHQPDGFSGVTRADVLNRAFFGDRNVERAAQMFIAFTNEKAQAIERQPKTPEVKPQNDLSKHVQIPLSKQPQMTPGERPTITRAFINEFYAKKRRGEYTSEEAARLEAQIVSAAAAGKVI